MRPEILTISPALAKEWMLNNVRNRHLSKPLIEKYAGAMQRGEWVENGDAIRFDIDGHLLDGQHRLMAVCLSGVAIRSLVLWDVAPTAQDTIDIGKRRRLGDVLAIRGESNAATLAAAIAQIWRFERGQETERGAPSPQQAITLLAKHPDLRASIPVALRVYRRIWLRPGLGTALHYHFRRIDSSDADDFFEKLAMGADLAEDSPILLLRRALQRERSKELGLAEFHVAALVIKAWNAYRQNEPMRLLRWSPGGSRPEAFPKAR